MIRSETGGPVRHFREPWWLRLWHRLRPLRTGATFTLTRRKGMKTSDRLTKIAEDLRDQLQDLRRLAVDLPSGRTLDVVELTEVMIDGRIRTLLEEAAQLRRYLD